MNAPAGTDHNALEGCRLLLAEDHMTVALSLSFLLEIYGCCISKAARCDQCLALIESQPFDVALLDVTLADGFVYPAAEALAARNIPLLFLTGFSDHHLPEAWRDWPVLGKTIDPDKIAQRLIALYRGH